MKDFPIVRWLSDEISIPPSQPGIVIPEEDDTESYDDSEDEEDEGDSSSSE